MAQLIVIAAGASAALFMIRIFWGGQPQRIGNAGEILERLGNEQPGFRPGRLIIGANRLAGIVLDAEHREFVLVLAHGARPLLFRRSKSALRYLKVHTVGETIEIRCGLRDFSVPRTDLLIASRADAECIVEEFRPFCTPPSGWEGS